jgi:hypothetical protein
MNNGLWSLNKGLQPETCSQVDEVEELQLHEKTERPFSVKFNENHP